MIREVCSCGASIKTDEPDSLKLVREWRGSHTCITDITDSTGHAHAESQTQITMGFQPGELPARVTDPFDD